MRRDQIATLAGLCAVPATVAAAASSSSNTPGVVHMGITRTNRAVPPSSIRRRADTYTETLGNNISYGGYFASVSVGTPAQTQQVILDTGSSDTWFLSSDASVCQTTTSSSGSSSGGGGGGGPSMGPGSASRRKSGLGRRQTTTSSCLSTCKCDGKCSTAGCPWLTHIIRRFLGQLDLLQYFVGFRHLVRRRQRDTGVLLQGHARNRRGVRHQAADGPGQHVGSGVRHHGHRLYGQRGCRDRVPKPHRQVLLGGAHRGQGVQSLFGELRSLLASGTS